MLSFSSNFSDFAAYLLEWNMDVENFENNSFLFVSHVNYLLLQNKLPENWAEKNKYLYLTVSVFEKSGNRLACMILAQNLYEAAMKLSTGAEESASMPTHMIVERTQSSPPEPLCRFLECLMTSDFLQNK